MARSTGTTTARTWLLLGGVLLVAGTCTALIYGVMADYQAALREARARVPMVEVVQTARDLEPGVPIEREDLVVATVPAGSVPEAEVFLGDQLKDALGLIPVERVLAGEPLRRERMDARAARAALDRIIAPGARAASLLLSSAAGLSGLLHPADRVDVIVTIRPDSEALEADWVTETILQNARVLAVDRAVIGGRDPQGAETSKDDKKRTSSGRKVVVTLEVLPEEAEKLALASTRGDLQLSLRQAEDDALVEDRGPLVTNTLVGIAKLGEGTRSAERRTEARKAQTRQSPPPVAPAHSTEVIVGDQRSTSTYDQSGERIDGSTRKGR